MHERLEQYKKAEHPPDLKAFLKSIGAFYFHFRTDQERPENLISKLEEAGADTEAVLHEQCDSSPWVVLSNVTPVPGNARNLKDAFLTAHARYYHSMS